MRTSLDISHAATAALLAIAIGQTLFVLFYATLPWWRTRLGFALFVQGFSLALLVDVGITARLLTFPYEQQVILVLYWLCAVGVWGQFLAFVLQSRHQPTPLEDADPHKEPEGADR